MGLAITSLPGLLLSRTPRLAKRLIFSLLISSAAVLSLVICRQTARVVFGRTSREVAGSLNLIVRDSMTGSALSSELAADGKNGLPVFAPDAEGTAPYQLSGRRGEPDIHVVA